MFQNQLSGGSIEIMSVFFHIRLRRLISILLRIFGTYSRYASEHENTILPPQRNYNRRSKRHGRALQLMILMCLSDLCLIEYMPFFRLRVDIQGSEFT